MSRAEDLFERLITGGVNVIDQFIADRQSEELFLDFKRSADDGQGHKLHDNDRESVPRSNRGARSEL